MFDSYLSKIPVLRQRCKHTRIHNHAQRGTGHRILIALLTMSKPHAMACHVNTNFQHALQGNVDQANRGVCSVWLNAIVGMRSAAFQMWNDAGTTREQGGRRLRPPPQTVPLAVFDFVQPVLCELTPRVGEQRAMAESTRTCGHI